MDSSTPRSKAIVIEAPARLHLGFLDLNGGLGRRFGSIGLTLNEISTKIVVQHAQQILVEGDITGRFEKFAQRFSERKNLLQGCNLTVIDKIPDHSGLGSGTQLALALGSALSKLNNLEFNASEIAQVLGRGARSGIGIGAFQYGGFLVDGGRSPDSIVPPIISRVEFPSHWRAILILDEGMQGAHGEEEFASFSALPTFPSEGAANLCRIVLMQVLPALSENNIEEFNKGIYEIQRCLGTFFASEQGGRYTSAAVGEAVAFLEAQGIRGVGQSSWGPTGFAFVSSETQAYSVLRDLLTKFHRSKLEFKIVSGRNFGATIEENNLEKETEENISLSNTK